MKLGTLAKIPNSLSSSSVSGFLVSLIIRPATNRNQSKINSQENKFILQYGHHLVLSGLSEI